MVILEKLIAFMIIVILLNIPFGSYRLLTRRFSPAWWLAIHLPIPLIVLLRGVAFQLPLWVLPVSLVSAATGQIIGGRIPHCGQGVRRLLFRQVSST